MIYRPLIYFTIYYKGMCDIFMCHLLNVKISLLLRLIPKIYALFASRSYVMQFRFFCRALTKASQTWCLRFQNSMNNGKVL